MVIDTLEKVIDIRLIFVSITKYNILCINVTYAIW